MRIELDYDTKIRVLMRRHDLRWRIIPVGAEFFRPPTAIDERNIRIPVDDQGDSARDYAQLLAGLQALGLEPVER